MERSRQRLGLLYLGAQLRGPIVSGKRPGRFKELVSRDKRLPVGQILHCDITGAYFSDAALAHSRIYSENDEVFCRQLASQASNREPEHPGLRPAGSHT